MKTLIFSLIVFNFCVINNHCVRAVSVVSATSASSSSTFQSEREYFDLGYTLDETNAFFPGRRFEKFELFRDMEGYNFTVPNHTRFWFAEFAFCTIEHSGTHVDAPFHFNENGWKLEEIPLTRLMDIPLAIVDVENDVFAMENPSDFKLQVEHILEHEKKFGTILKNSVVFINYGWSRFWPGREQYLGEKNGVLNFPGLSGNAAELLVQRGVFGVGSDTASIEAGSSFSNPVAHITLCGNQIYLIENLANLKNLLEKTRSQSVNGNAGAGEICDLRATILPMKTKGTGGPARVLAYCDKS